MAAKPGLALGEEPFDDVHAARAARRQRHEHAPDRVDDHPQAARTRRPAQRELERAGGELGDVTAFGRAIGATATLAAIGGRWAPHAALPLHRARGALWGTTRRTSPPSNVGGDRRECR